MRALAFVGIWGGLALTGCTKDEGTLPADTDGAGDDCGTTAPVVETVDITNLGMTDPDVDDSCGADAVPLVQIQARVADDDGDLHYWTLKAWWDTVVDGNVDTSSGGAEVSGTYGLECGVAQLDVAMILCLSGDPPYATEVEWATQVFDDENHGSNVLITTFTTPHADGTP